jgi:hypothetical protein
MSAKRWGLWVAVVAAGLMSGAALADDSATLKYKFARGDKLIYRTKSSMKQNQTIAGMAHDNEMESDTIQTITVDGIDDKGNFQVSIKGERIKVKAKFGVLGEFAFDSQSSDRDKSSMIGAALTPLYERLSGSVYHAVVAPDGDILKVTGYADLVRDLIEGNPLTAQFAGGGTDDAAKESLREIFPRLNKSSVKLGDSWEAPFEIALGKVGVTKGKNSYRYAGPDKVGDRPTAKVEVTSEASVNLDIEMDGVKVTGTLSSTAAGGTVQFDHAAGRMLTSQSAVTIGGMLNINANGMDIPLQNEQNMKNEVEYLAKLPE